ncbi:hypothetical protein Tcan_13800 [Toxocara canis]|uniref:DUF148 domain-containing protein n=1 Tax=Toxocara canis TaxID=6265 RepID=A0A0B2VPA2_TOXCA|nr:hypothetical protein Tcan_13800 [Toxocara canis]
MKISRPEALCKIRLSGLNGVHHFVPQSLQSSREQVKKSFADFMGMKSKMESKNIKESIDAWAQQQLPQIKALYNECKQKMVAFYNNMAAKVNTSNLDQPAKTSLQKMGEIESNRKLTWADDKAQTQMLMQTITPEAGEETVRSSQVNTPKDFAGLRGGNSVLLGSPLDESQTTPLSQPRG